MNERNEAAVGERVRHEVDVVVVGAGPSGLAAAIALRQAGVARVEVLERESAAGGIPRHCAHTGYGVRDLRRVMSGPRYARHYAQAARAAGVELSTTAMVTGWSADGGLEVSSPAGLRTVHASAVLLATGARERGRAARWVPGDRGRASTPRASCSRRCTCAASRSGAGRWWSVPSTSASRP